MKYYAIEFQTNGTTGAAIPFAMDGIAASREKFHTCMAAAEVSAVEKHGAVIIDENLNILNSELGYRENPVEAAPVFFVLEFQTGNGSAACLPLAYASKADAWEKFYDILRFAAKSSVEKHGAMIITSDLFKVDARVAERNTTEPVEDGEGE